MIFYHCKRTLQHLAVITMVLLNPSLQQKWNASLFKVCLHAEYMNSNNVLETFSKSMSYVAVCNCRSVQGSSTHNQWPVTSPRPHRVSGTPWGQSWCYSSWTEQQYLLCAVFVTPKERNETAGCLLLFPILNVCSLPNISWVFTPVVCWRRLRKVKYDVDTALSTTYLFSSSTVFARQPWKCSQMLCCWG